MTRGKSSYSIFCLICVLMFMNLIGCGFEKKKDNTKNIVQSDKHYASQIIDVPNGEEVTAICKSDSEVLYVVTGDGKNSNSLWSIDDSNKWKMEYNFRDLLAFDKNVYCEAYPSGDGGVFLQVNATASEVENPFNSGELSYIYMDKSGINAKGIELKLPEINQQSGDGHGEVDKLNHVVKAKYINGYMYALDANCNIFQIDIGSGNSKCVFENTQYDNSSSGESLCIDEFDIYDEHIIVVFEDMLGFEGLENHEKEKEMTDRFSDFFSQAREPLAPVKLSIDDNMLWTISNDKICSYNLDNNESVQYKVIGTNSNEYVSSQVVCNDNMYATVYSFVDKKTYLYKYTNDGEAATVSDAISQKLKIWRLDSAEDSVSDSVRRFTDKYPNVEVEIEMGIAGGITPEDAIKNLNTQILAGDGPDIIYMDGLNIDKYIESGELEDISDIVKELEASGDYFNNILEAFSKENKVYVLPQSVDVIGKVGKKDAIEASEDGSKFLEYIENNKSNHPFIPYYSLNNYLGDQYYKYIKEDILKGTIEKDELRNYFEVSKKLINLQGMVDFPPHTLYLFTSGNYALAYDDAYEFLMCNISNVYAGPMSMDNIAKQVDGIVDYPSKEYQGYYVPCECMAISSKSENKELAAEYIKSTLSEEYLSENIGSSAFTVNKKALVKNNQLEARMYSTDEAGDLSEEEQKKVDEYIENTISYLETVDKPLTRDVLLDQMFFDELYRYLSDEADLDAVVDGLFEKYKIYMEE